MGAKPRGSRAKKIKHVVHIAREYGLVAGAGGIKDVTSGLCKATADAGISVHMFLPHYRKADDYIAREHLSIKTVCSFVVTMNYGSYVQSEKVVVSTCIMAQNLTLYLLKADPFRYLAEAPERKIPRHGIYQYTKAEADALGKPGFYGNGYADAFAQNVLFVKSVLSTLKSVSWRPDIVHCHDGHAALFSLIAQTADEGYPPYSAHLPTLLTIHNAGKGYHQETAGFDYAHSICGINRSDAKEIVGACALAGAFDPLLAGGIYSTAVNTVSENYARELRETGQDAVTGWLGHAFLSRGINLLGITNGIDPKFHDSRDAARLGLPVAFSIEDEDWQGKALCKQKVIEQLNTSQGSKGIKKYGHISDQAGRALFTFVGRLTAQKGFDVLYSAMKTLLAEDEEIALWGLGTGDQTLVKSFKGLADQYRGRVCFMEGYSEYDANRIFAAGDFFLIPSRFEPCGLTDFIAQLMGNVPIVHRVGGLVKTIDNKTGFSYLGGADELRQTIKRALKIYRTPGKKRLRSIQRTAFKKVNDHSTWDKVFKQKYLPLYEKMLEKVEPILPY